MSMLSKIHVPASSVKKFLAPEGGPRGGGEQGKPKPSDENELLGARSNETYCLQKSGFLYEPYKPIILKEGSLSEKDRLVIRILTIMIVYQIYIDYDKYKRMYKGVVNTKEPLAEENPLVYAIIDSGFFDEMNWEKINFIIDFISKITKSSKNVFYKIELIVHSIENTDYFNKLGDLDEEKLKILYPFVTISILQKQKYEGSIVLSEILKQLELEPDEKGKFNGLIFAGADLKKVIFDKIGLNGATFLNADLSKAVFHVICGFTDFNGAILTGTDLTGSEFDGCIFSKANFTRANLTRVIFVSCNFEEAYYFDDENGGYKNPVTKEYLEKNGAIVQDCTFSSNTQKAK